MDVLQTLVLGVVEGVTEFLPISSTGHLILVSSLLHLEQTDFLKSFEIIIQCGAILSVVALYWKTFLNIEVLKKLFVAFIPTGVVGLLFYNIVKTYLLGNETVVLWALFLGGVFLIVFELLHKEPKDATQSPLHMTYTQSFLVGLFQSVAIIPGVSRSAATIVGGLALGVSRRTIVEFSFLLAVPTMLAATGLDLVKNASSFSTHDAGLLAVGFALSFVVALLSIKFLLRFVKNHSFISFGIYRIAVAVVFFLFVVR